MCYLYSSRLSLLFSVELKGCAFQESSIVLYIHPNISKAKHIKGVYGSEDKQTQHLVSFVPAKFEMSKYISREFSVLMPFGTVISQYFGSRFTKEERNRWRKYFSSSKNVIWSILLKCQEKICKYKHSMTKIETSYIVTFLTVLTADL